MRSSRIARRRSAVAPTVLVVAAAGIVCSGIILAAQLATVDRLKEPGWWPTKRDAPRVDYVGAAQCSPCHPTLTASQSSTAMARTAARAERSEILRATDRLTFKNGPYSYEIASKGQQPLYTVADGSRSASAPLTWAFGVGNVGQSFLFERDGAFHEVRVSYYGEAHRLGFTPGRAVASPRDLDEAMSRPIGDEEIRRCFGCHTTASSTAAGFDPAGATPGVTCEACHGPARAHVAAMNQKPAAGAQTAIFNPASLKPEASVDFCGACHAAFFDIALSGESGIAAMRSQPYRLRSSRCWTVEDERLTCMACHNPHRPLVKDLGTYDKRCLACHVTSGQSPTAERPGHPCPVRTSECASCHMPKYEVTDMHHEFTDHRIQIPKQRP